MIELVLWISFLAVFYAYFGYPLVLSLLGKMVSRPVDRSNQDYAPGISVLIPAHNEASVIRKKLQNTFELDYPLDMAEFLFISDGSTDGTNEVIRSSAAENIRLIEINDRKGKANALNVGLTEAKHEIIVFSDASIMLDSSALRKIVLPFQDQEIGCVSGEDHIEESGGEGAYGRYELWLRNLESRIHSLVGASGSFYAQRKELCEPFGEGLAPDFLSVLNTVEKGFRAITEPEAFGFMTSVKNTSDEFNRKVRTLIRGMSALFYKKNLLNIFQYGLFSFALFSHKLMRWLVPVFLISLFVTNFILVFESSFYFFTFVAQIAFYILATIGAFNIFNIGKFLFVKVALYFSMVNLSILMAWIRFALGHRQEIWNPSKR